MVSVAQIHEEIPIGNEKMQWKLRFLAGTRFAETRFANAFIKQKQTYNAQLTVKSKAIELNKGTHT